MKMREITTLCNEEKGYCDSIISIASSSVKLDTSSIQRVNNQIFKISQS